MVNKHLIMTEFMEQCPQINFLFQIYSRISDGNVVIAPIQGDEVVANYIDGSKLRQYTFNIATFENFDIDEYSYDNVKNLANTEKIMDWINEQNKNRNFPDFGDNTISQSISNMNDMPRQSGQDINNKLAKYSFTIVYEYIEK